MVEKGNDSKGRAVHVLSEQSYERHGEACASGARAELRGPCDCGAMTERPVWRIRIVRLDGGDEPMLDIGMGEWMTSTEAVMLSIALQRATVECARLRVLWRKSEAPRVPFPLCARCNEHVSVSLVTGLCGLCLDAQSMAHGDAPDDDERPPWER